VLGRFPCGCEGTGQPESAGWSLEPNTVAGGLAFIGLGVGLSHSCALTSAGAVYCWGTRGKLGAPSATLHPDESCGNSPLGGEACAHAPVRTELPARARALFVGPGESCAITVGGELWCWGETPRRVTVPGEAASVALGEQHTCVLTMTGEAHCLGVNDHGALGTGNTGEPETDFVPVTGGLRFITLSAGRDTTCGLTGEGALYCWGSNEFGQLGTGDRLHRASPVRVRLREPAI